MCGRYYIAGEDAIEKVVTEVDERVRKAFFRGDIRPMDSAPVIEPSERGLKLNVCKWGYPLSKGKNLIINARVESVMDKPAFYNGIRYHRVIIPASGFYEWNSWKERDSKGILIMNIQIFGTKKCNDTKKAERFFKERGIKYQFIDMKEKGMSKGEFNAVAQMNGGLENMINWDGKNKDLLALIKYIADEDKLEKVLENPQVIKTPVVRNGKQSTLGYQPDIWKGWS